MEFSLDFAWIRMPNGQILRQTGRHSAIARWETLCRTGSCAWMEQEWLKTITASDIDGSGRNGSWTKLQSYMQTLLGGTPKDSLQTSHSRNALLYLMLLGETSLGLPYSLWALPDLSELPGCLWLVRHWGTQVYRSSSLKFCRYMTLVRCQCVVRPPRHSSHGNGLDGTHLYVRFFALHSTGAS